MMGLEVSATIFLITFSFSASSLVERNLLFCIMMFTFIGASESFLPEIMLGRTDLALAFAANQVSV